MDPKIDNDAPADCITVTTSDGTTIEIQRNPFKTGHVEVTVRFVRDGATRATEIACVLGEEGLWV